MDKDTNLDRGVLDAHVRAPRLPSTLDHRGSLCETGRCTKTIPASKQKKPIDMPAEIAVMGS